MISRPALCPLPVQVRSPAHRRASVQTRPCGIPVGRFGFPRHPFEDVAVILIHQRFELIEFSLIKRPDFGIGKTADHQIHLADAAPPGAHQNAAASWIKVCARTCCSGHENPLSVGGTAYPAIEELSALPSKQICRSTGAMRPLELDPLFVTVESLPGIGPKSAEALARVTGRDGPEDTRALDLLLLAPHSMIDRTMRAGITEAPEGTIATLKVRVDRHQPSPPGRRSVPYRVYVHDETGEMALTFFHSKQAWLEKILPVGETVLISGKVEWFNGRPSMVHPDHIVAEADADSLPLIEPVYPLTAGSVAETAQAIDRSRHRHHADLAGMGRSASGCQKQLSRYGRGDQRAASPVGRHGSGTANPGTAQACL
jgi:hypothetical protein